MGGDYIIVVDCGGDGCRGPFDVAVSCAVPPSAVCGESYSGNTEGGSNYGEYEHAYTLHLDNTYDIVIDTCGSDYDTYVRIFSGSMFNGGREECSCDDCGPCGTQTVLECTLNEGDYFVVIGGYSYRHGNYVFSTGCTSPAYTEHVYSSCSADPLYQLNRDVGRGYDNYYTAVAACELDPLCGGFQDRSCNGQREHACMHVCVYVCMYVTHVCMYACMHACMHA